jgi:hypothetical protein
MGRWGHTMWQTGTMCVLGGCLVAIVGCASLGFGPTAPFTPVPIERLNEVAGRWEGRVKAEEGFESVWVTVDITSHESYVTYTFVGTGRRTPFIGAGRLQLLDGRLLTEEENRALTFTLAEQGGARVLLVTGIAKEGKTIHAELKRPN